MKKLLVLLLVLFMAAGFAAADDDGIGLTAGLEFGINDINKPNDAEESDPYIEASIEYENSFLDKALDIYAGLAYDLHFNKNEYDDTPHGLWFDFSIGYNLKLSSASTLTPILENENYIDFSASEDSVLGILKPGIKFNQNIDDVGDLYFQLDVPLAYAYYGAEDTFVGLDFTLGWASTFGLGLEASGHVLISPNDEDLDVSGFTGMGFTASYENVAETIYAELAVTIPLKNLKYGAPYNYFDSSEPLGISITPLFQYTFDFGLAAYLSITFDGIGITDNDLGVSPAIGVKYSF